MEVTPMPLTSWGEVAAFLLARALTIGFLFFAYHAFLSALYSQLIRQGGASLVMVVSQGVAAAAWLVTLVLFLLFRAGFGAVPATVAQDRRDAVTSSGGEIGAYVLSAVVVVAAVTGLNIWVTPGIYLSLRTSGHIEAIVAVSLAISVVASIVFFLVFVALRAAMSPPAASQTSP
jgi:hypothetical protein